MDKLPDMEVIEGMLRDNPDIAMVHQYDAIFTVGLPEWERWELTATIWWEFPVLRKKIRKGLWSICRNDKWGSLS